MKEEETREQRPPASLLRPRTVRFSEGLGLTRPPALPLSAAPLPYPRSGREGASERRKRRPSWAPSPGLCVCERGGGEGGRLRLGQGSDSLLCGSGAFTPPEWKEEREREARGVVGTFPQRRLKPVEDGRAAPGLRGGLWHRVSREREREKDEWATGCAAAAAADSWLPAPERAGKGSGRAAVAFHWGAWTGIRPWSEKGLLLCLFFPSAGHGRVSCPSPSHPPPLLAGVCVCVWVGKSIPNSRAGWLASSHQPLARQLFLCLSASAVKSEGFVGRRASHALNCPGSNRLLPVFNTAGGFGLCRRKASLSPPVKVTEVCQRSYSLCACEDDRAPSAAGKETLGPLSLAFPISLGLGCFFFVLGEEGCRRLDLEFS